MNICDHMFSGNACCPCGKFTNPNVKSVCVMVEGKQTWPTPYGEFGVGLATALKLLRKEYETMIFADVIEIAWEEQMITGTEYIEQLMAHGYTKLISKEKLK